MNNNSACIKKVNLNKFPSIQKVEQNIVIGDIHGNAQYLLHLLVRFGVLQLDKQQYLKLIEIYKKNTDDITADDLINFRKILHQSKVSNDISILFLGDTLSDRGNNDFFSLCIFRLLSRKKVPFKILLANHDYEFLNCYEESFNKQNVRYISKNIKRSQTCSMTNLQKLLDKKLYDSNHRSVFSERTIKRWIKSHMLQHFQAIGYTLGEQNIIIYSHAPIDIAIIRRIAEKLEIPFEDKTVHQLAATIDNINAKIQELLQTHNLCSKFTSMHHKSSEDNPLKQLIWNRDYNKLDRSYEHNSYHVEYVHGHDKPKSIESNTISLDQKLGKSSKKTQGEFEYVLVDNFGFFTTNKPQRTKDCHKTLMKSEPSVERHHCA